MSYLSIELYLKDHKALVIGAPQGELRSKIDRLLQAGAFVTVIAPPECVDALDAFGQTHHDPRLELVCRKAVEEDAIGKSIVFLAPGDDALSLALHAYGRKTGTPVCTLDRPEMSTFINPATVCVSGLRISVGTQGTSPSLARRIREDLELLFSDEAFARFMNKLAGLRAALPRGERAARMKEAVLGFGIEARLHLPSWFSRGEEPPS